MKFYVSELPKSCESCPFHDTKHGRCDISGLRVEYFGCHSLTPLSDHDKQVRKETIDDLAVSLIMHLSKDAEFTVEEIYNWLQKAKDQIERE